MAEGDILSNINLNFDTMKVQGFMNIVFWVIAALIGIGLIIFLFIKIRQRMTYNILVRVRMEAGDVPIEWEDRAKKVIDGEGNYFFHYLGLNKHSPVIKDKYLHIIKKKRLGIIPYSVLGFDAYLKDGKIIPMELNRVYEYDQEGNLIIREVSLTGIDYDAFNFLQAQIKANIARYQKIDRLLQLAPYALLLLVVIAFIVGMVFYTQHIENVAKTILGVAEKATNNIIEKANLAQIIPQG